jgi:pimeloyl-ACP methyl ester carboxylesterase
VQDLNIAIRGKSVAAGEAWLAATPVLRPHVGTQPDLLLRWNEIPLVADAVDVVVFLHGFSQQGRDMPLAEKAAGSGLELSGRNRPTLALLPRGNWLRYTWYDFPALLSGGIDRLVAYGLERFAAALGREALCVERLVLAAHSGGGMPAVDTIAGALRPPDELYVFDGLYGRNPATGDPMQGIETIERWLDERLAREPQREGALRVLYKEQQTGRFSRAVAAVIARRLAEFEPSLAEALRRRYRVEASAVPHPHIARRCLPELLTRSDIDFDWSKP